jgi:hypothetical protein
MGKTILELFENKDSFKYGTVYSEVKEEKETLVEQETSGVRIRSAVELNNPLIYGNEATRIAIRSTPLVEDMKGATGGEGGDGGLIGKGLEKITGGKFGKAVFGGKVSSLSEARNGINTKLGIPQAMIPTRLIGDIKGLDSQEPITLDSVGKGLQGTGLGSFLKESGGGNPKTILRQGAGKLVGKAKDKLRGALFGSPQGLGDANSTRGTSGFGQATVGSTEPEPMVRFTTNEQGLTYSEQKNPLLGKIKPDDLKGTKLDLSLVSPIYGVRRNSSTGGAQEGRFGKTKNAFQIDGGYAAQRHAPNKPENTYMGGKTDTPLYSVFGLGVGDSINLLSPGDEYTLDDNNAFAKQGDKVLYDFIPVWMKKIGSSKPIMFRALISGLTENVSPSWSTSKFVGNPYNFYTFDSIERSTSFNLKMYCNNSTELAVNWEKITKITQMTYPSIGAQYANAPIMRFRIGDIYNNKTGFIESLTYTIPDDSNWETDGESGYLPKIIDVAITIKFIESVGAEDRPYDYTISKTAAKAINDKRGANAEIGASQTEGDGSVSDEKPPKEETKAGKALGNAKEDAKSKLNKTGDKIKNTAGAIKSAVTKPADQESAKLADNANQGGTADKLDGKTPTASIKDLETKGIPPKMASQITSLKTMGYEECSKSLVPIDQQKFIRETTGQSKFFKRSQFNKWDIYQVTSDFGIPRRVAGGLGTI